MDFSDFSMEELSIDDCSFDSGGEGGAAVQQDVLTIPVSNPPLSDGDDGGGATTVQQDDPNCTISDDDVDKILVCFLSCPACENELKEVSHPQDHKGTSVGKIAVWHCSHEHDAVREIDGKAEFRLSLKETEKWTECNILERWTDQHPHWKIQHKIEMPWSKLSWLKQVKKTKNGQKVVTTKRKGVVGINCQKCLSQVDTEAGLAVLCAQCREFIGEGKHEVR